MKKTRSFLLTAGIALATAFTLFACSSDDSDDNGGGNSSSSGYGDKGNDIKNYKTKTIGTQTWMAENLNYAVEGSKCYGESGKVAIDYDDRGDPNPITAKTLTDKEVQANCATYGRLYDWATAMGFEPSCNSAICANRIQNPHRGICPQGWHIPNNGDWDELLRFVDGENDGNGGNGEEGRPYYSYTAGRYLKATSGWNNYDGITNNGIDKYGFSALPGGVGSGNEESWFGGIGSYGYWWSASEYDSDSGLAYTRNTYYGNNYVISDEKYKSVLYSVRCVKD